jgi:hypothetical protein
VDSRGRVATHFVGIDALKVVSAAELILKMRVWKHHCLEACLESIRWFSGTFHRGLCTSVVETTMSWCALQVGGLNQYAPATLHREVVKLLAGLQPCDDTLGWVEAPHRWWPCLFTTGLPSFWRSRLGPAAALAVRTLERFSKGSVGTAGRPPSRPATGGVGPSEAIRSSRACCSGWPPRTQPGEGGGMHGRLPADITLNSAPST